MRRTLVALAAFLLTAAAPPPDPYQPGCEILTGLHRIVTPRGVQETFEATLGGARQVVNVRGADRDNPILLFIHGGPGAVEMPFAWTFQRPWEDFFTVVQYDQRGAGRSYLLSDPKALAPTLTIDRYRDDAIELIDLLRKRYGKRKVVLVGHSWGSVVGLSVAAKRPDLLYAYVGMGQYVDPAGGERASYDWTLAQARREGNAEAIRDLEALEPYPGDFAIERIDGERKWAVHYGGLFAHRSDGQFYFDAARISPEYTPAHRKAWGEGSAYTVKIVEPQLAKLTFTTLKRLDCPVFMFVGRHDWLVPARITADWLAQVQAPRKRTIWFENSAHMMMVEEPGRTLAALLEHVRPLATEH
ncbi:alpha/beta fold hydrolase [Sphingomonas sp.]|uniref:alpha/beta fold hydrolase n=1 Tax=Sphingomonas sp. TaxID=28214 RepID=UPI0035C80FB9